jgi:peptide-methionine (R)-S-oxide reductase
VRIRARRIEMNGGARIHRRQWLKRIFTLAAAPVSVPVMAIMNSPEQSARDDEQVARLEKSKAEWRKLLAPEAYAVIFEERTEPPFSSPLDKEKRQGTYICAACHLPLFSSKAKFDSGTGWPSFYEPIKGRLATKRDYWLILPRTEYHCIRCRGHQGHVFDDGPPPTGQRWCNNGVALKFVPDGEPLPELRT